MAASQSSDAVPPADAVARFNRAAWEPLDRARGRGRHRRGPPR